MSIQLPSLKSLRTLCDQMKKISSNFRICGITSGDLSFIVETESAMVVSRYFNLKVDAEHESQTNVEISCNIDTKHLSMCFGSLQVNDK